MCVKILHTLCRYHAGAPTNMHNKLKDCNVVRNMHKYLEPLSNQLSKTCDSVVCLTKLPFCVPTWTSSRKLCLDSQPFEEETNMAKKRAG